MIQLILTLKMTTAQVVETSVTVNNNSPIQDYVHPDDQTQPTFEFFSVLELKIYLSRDYYFKNVNSYHKNGPCFMILALTILYFISGDMYNCGRITSLFPASVICMDAS